MMRTEGELFGIFSATAEGDLDGVYYTYEVHTSDGIFCSHDPYRKPILQDPLLAILEES